MPQKAWPVLPTIMVDQTGLAKTSVRGKNLYAHKRADGFIVNCYYATKKTTLWEATMPFRYSFGIFFLLKAAEWAVKKLIPKTDTLLTRMFAPLVKNGQLNKWLFAVVVVTFLIDDVGTSIGMQAKEEPEYYENNVGFCIWMEYLIINGWANTHTDGFRIVCLINLFALSMFQYFGLFGPLSGTWLTYIGLRKTWDGFPWWFAGPNNYGILKFLMFDPGRATPHRMGLTGKQMYYAHKQGANVVTVTRRRMAERDAEIAQETLTWGDIWEMVHF